MIKLNRSVYYYMIMALAFTMPLSRAMISAIVGLLVLFWLFEGNFRKKIEQIKSNKVLVAFSLFFALNILSILWSSNMQEALNSLRLNGYLLVIFVIATKIKKEQINNIITAFLVGMFVSEIIAYGVFFELWEFGRATVQNPSPFMFWIDYSVFMAFTSILLLNRIVSKHYTMKQKLLLFLFFLTVTGNLFLAIGRTGQIAFIVGVFVMMMLHYRLTIKSMLFSLLFLSTIFISAYNVSDSFQLRSQAALKDMKNISNMDLNGSWGIRVAYWITSYDVFKSSPLVGVGIGDYQDETKYVLETNDYPYFSEHTKEFMKKYHPHNQYLLVAMQLGLIGLVFFIYTPIRKISAIFSPKFMLPFALKRLS